MGPSMSRASQFQRRTQLKKFQASKRRFESQRALSQNKLPLTGTKATKQTSVPKMIRQPGKDYKNILEQLLQKQVKQGISTQSQYQNPLTTPKQPVQKIIKKQIISPSAQIFDQYKLTHNEKQKFLQQCQTVQVIKNPSIKSPISSLIINQAQNQVLQNLNTIKIENSEYKIDVDRDGKGIKQSKIISIIQCNQQQLNQNIQYYQHHKSHSYQSNMNNAKVHHTIVDHTSHTSHSITNTNNFIRDELKQNYSHKKKYIVESATMSIGNLGLVSFDGRNKLLESNKKLDNSSRIPQYINLKASQSSVSNSIDKQLNPKRLVKISQIAPQMYENMRKVQEQYYEYKKQPIINTNGQSNSKDSFESSLQNSSSVNRSRSLSSIKSIKVIKRVRK